MNVVQERFLELYHLRKYRKLTPQEEQEWRECEKWLDEYHWKLGRLKNLSFMAYQTNDWDWLHEICAEIDRLKGPS